MSDEQTRLCADLVAHRISRAAFLRRAAALGLSAPAAASLLAACGSGSGAGSTTVGAGGEQVGTAVTTPAPSGEVDLVKWALFYEPSSLDWIFAYNYEENTVVANVTESLMRITPQFTLQPALAESFSRPDPTKIAYTIRQGVMFGDGTPMTTEDVLFSLRRNLDPNSFWWFAFEAVDAVDQTGPNEVTISSKAPNELLHWLMATPAGAVGKAAEIKAKGKSYGTPAAGPVGTGPFAFQSWNQGASITLVRNDGYWDTAHRPRVRQIDFSFIPEESTMTSALLSGQVDGAYHTPYSGLDQLRSGGAGKLYLGKSMIFTAMYIAATSGPLADPAIRNALILATDRAALARTVYNGAAAPLRDTMIAPSMWGYGRQAALAAYRKLPGETSDPAKAKALAGKASTPARPIVIATRASLQRYIQIATIVQDAARKIGLEARIKTISPNDYGDLFFSSDARKGIDLFVSENYIDVPEPLELTYTVTPQPANGVSYNYNNYDDPVVTRAMRSALGEFDDDKRAALILAAQERMASDPPLLPLVNPAVPLFLNKRLTGAPASFCYLYYPWARDLGAA